MKTQSLFELKINGIDCYGLNEGDRRSIQELGFYRWLEHQSFPSYPHDAGPQNEFRGSRDENLTRKRLECVICGKTFYAQRSDAKYCGDRCKKKGSRRGIRHRGQHVTVMHGSHNQKQNPGG